MENRPKETTETSTDILRKNIIKESDICVRCGLCLPHCPTYLVAEVEMESPRGRIIMAKALAEDPETGKLPTPSMKTHLDNCLGCMACEAMCPAKVPYHDLMINTREMLYKDRPLPIPKFLTFFLNHLNSTVLLQRLYKFYQKMGLGWFFKKTGLARLLAIEKYQEFMPDNFAIANFKELYPAKDSLAKGNIAIFIGCVNQLCDAKTIFYAIDVCNALGYNVHIPKNQACCGAIHRHNGAPSIADAYLHKNSSVFASQHFDAIITLATGCHDSLLKLNQSDEKLKNTPILDIHDFILNQPDDNLQLLDPLINSAKVLLIHTPCTLRNIMKKADLLEKVLLKLGVQQYKHLQSSGCCGAAGLLMWNNPKLANALAAPLIQQILAEKPDYVISANIGCQLHLQRNLHELGSSTRVLHLLNLIFPKNRVKS